MAIEYNNIRTIMLEYLRSHPNGQFNLIGDQSLFRLFSERGFTLDDDDLEVLQQVAEGLSNREIANQLYLAESTVKSHLNTVYRKLGVKNRTQAVAKARELNLL